MTTVADFEHIPVSKGLDLYVLPTTKFKSILVKANLHRPLGDRATGIALLPQILRRGCRGAVNMRKIVLFLEDLYGASMGADILKLGERQILTFRMEFINDKFAPKKIQTLQKGLKFLSDIMLRPVKEKNRLRADVVTQEKENLKRLIEGRINDRASYSFDRCIEEMCADEPYGLYEYGSLKALPGESAATLTSLHEEVTKTSPMSIYVSGDVSPKRVATIVGEAFRRTGRKPMDIPAPAINPAPAEPRTIVERQPVEQGNLVIGCRSGITYRDPEIFDAVMANAVLGGYAHSKLFANVREKKGLAYSASSSFEKTKGLVFITAGIDFARYDEALATIREQLEDVQAGRITDEEFDKTRMSILDGLQSRDDSPSSRMNSLEEQLVNGCPMTGPEMIARVEAVTKDSIAKAARKVFVDTVYFLTGPNGNA